MGGCKSPPIPIRKFNMRLKIFIRHQNESSQPFMCINTDHAMPLIPLITDDLNIILKCFIKDCGYVYYPGLLVYEKILKEQLNV
jgi:hypothetical protein